MKNGYLPFRVNVNDEGTMGTSSIYKNNCWWQTMIISNELTSPKLWSVRR